MGIYVKQKQMQGDVQDLIYNAEYKKSSLTREIMNIEDFGVY